MRTHIKIVGWVYIVFCVLRLFGAAAMMFGGIFGGLMSGNVATLLMAGASGMALGLVFGGMALLGLIAGFAFLSHRPWARYVLIFVSILNLFSWPIGTLISIYALWVLFNKETETLFKIQERMA